MMIADIQSFAMIFTDILEFSVRCYSRYMDHVASVSCRVVCIDLNHVAGMSQRAACAQKNVGHDLLVTPAAASAFLLGIFWLIVNIKFIMY